MKNAVKIFVSMALAALLHSCVMNHDGSGVSTRTGVIEVAIQNDSSASDDAREDISTVRLFIFDNASTNPKLNLNALYSNTAETGTKVTVKAKTSSNADKMVVAILNEPGELSGMLSAIDHPSSLEDVAYRFADLFNSNQTALLASSNGMPMTGVLRHIQVDETHTDTSPKSIPMIVERVVARVDVYMDKDMTNTARLTADTRIRLKRSYGEGYLVAGTEDNYTRFQASDAENFGHMLTVDPAMLTVVSEWAPPGDVALTTTARRVCFFYTPERTCIATNDADKLVLEFANIHIDGVGSRNGEVTISRMETAPGSVTDPNDLNLKMIRRNNVYEIYNTVKSQSMNYEAHALNWADATNVDAEFGTPYLLEVSEHECNVSAVIKTHKLVIKTDHPNGWTAQLYNDASCSVPMTDGWMTLSAYTGATAPNGAETIITIGNAAVEGTARYIKFTAGRKSLIVKVNLMYLPIQ